MTKDGVSLPRIQVAVCECGGTEIGIKPHAADCPSEDDFYWHGDDPEPPERIAARTEHERRLRHVEYVPAVVTDEMVERAAEAAWQAWPSNAPEPSWSALQVAVRAAIESVLPPQSEDSA